MTPQEIDEIRARVETATGDGANETWRIRDPDVADGEDAIVDYSDPRTPDLFGAVAAVLNFARFMSFDRGHKECDRQMRKRADFIAHAPDDVRHLLTAYDEQAARIESLTAALEIITNIRCGIYGHSVAVNCGANGIAARALDNQKGAEWTAQILPFEADSGLSQSEAILRALKAGRRLTPLSALNDFGCFRLGGRIYDLKKLGHKIEKRMVVTNSGARVAEYFLLKSETS